VKKDIKLLIEKATPEKKVSAFKATTCKNLQNYSEIRLTELSDKKSPEIKVLSLQSYQPESFKCRQCEKENQITEVRASTLTVHDISPVKNWRERN